MHKLKIMYFKGESPEKLNEIYEKLDILVQKKDIKKVI